MILNSVNKRAVLTTTLIILIGFFGYSQEEQSLSKPKITIQTENFNNKEKQNKLQEDSQDKEIEGRKGELEKVTVRFQERWLVVTLLA